MTRGGILWRVAAVAAAAAMGFAGFVSYAFGSCHSSGGFCADELGPAHVSFYATGVVLLSAAAAVLARVVTRRWWYVAASAGAVAAVLLLLIAWNEELPLSTAAPRAAALS